MCHLTYELKILPDNAAAAIDTEIEINVEGLFAVRLAFIAADFKPCFQIRPRVRSRELKTRFAAGYSLSEPVVRLRPKLQMIHFVEKMIVLVENGSRFFADLAAGPEEIRFHVGIGVEIQQLNRIVLDKSVAVD